MACLAEPGTLEGAFLDSLGEAYLGVTVKDSLEELRNLEDNLEGDRRTYLVDSGIIIIF